jgi:threonine/homoserine/homoserine lactone efflux protein
MGVGGIILAILVMLGLQALLTNVAWLFFVLKTAGALYLAVGLWRGASQPLVEGTPAKRAAGSAGKSFVAALLTQLSNPKAVVVYGNIFTALLPRDLPRPIAILLPGLVFIVEAGWYSIVVLALSAASPRRAYLRCKTGIDRITGGVLGLLGIKLLVSAGPVR